VLFSGDGFLAFFPLHTLAFLTFLLAEISCEPDVSQILAAGVHFLAGSTSKEQQHHNEDSASSSTDAEESSRSGHYVIVDS